jgi:hypothetical protein
VNYLINDPVSDNVLRLGYDQFPCSGHTSQPSYNREGQASNHRLNPGLPTYALELIRTRYADFGRTLAIEVLLDKRLAA